MFIGHFAVGFAAKRWAPKSSLGLLLAAPLLLDVLWPVFCLGGIERFRVNPPGNNPFLRLSFDSYPWSHSLAMALVWGGMLGWLGRGTGSREHGRAGRAGAGLLALLVASHWVLDWVTHLPDMPLWPGGPELGLGLWASVPGTIAVESVMFLAGAGLYLGSTRGRDGIGRLGAGLFILLLAALYVQSLLAPPPPLGAETLVALIAATLVLLVPLAAWVDRHREAA